MRILEVGADGCLAELARNGLDEEAEALLSSLAGLDLKKAKRNGHEVFKCELSGLSLISDASFDVTLALESLRRLQTYADKRKTISEVFRVTKPDGLILLAFDSRARRDEPAKDGPLGEESLWSTGSLRLSNERACEKEAEELMSGFPSVCLGLDPESSLRGALRKASQAADDNFFGHHVERRFSACVREGPADEVRACVGVFQKTPALRLRYVDN
jgi:ubiquinone/menaquinone biosynthesis C-methylase UbiE